MKRLGNYSTNRLELLVQLGSRNSIRVTQHTDHLSTLSMWNWNQCICPPQWSW